MMFQRVSAPQGALPRECARECLANQDGQAMPLLLLMALPVVLLLGIVMNTGEQLDLKLRSQEAADSAAHAAASWAARTLNFISVTNVFQTKTFALICVMEGSKFASWHILIALGLKLAGAISQAAKLWPACASILGCAAWLACIACIGHLITGIARWASEVRTWTQWCKKFVPALWKVMKYTSLAQGVMVTGGRSLIAIDVERFYCSQMGDVVGRNASAMVVSFPLGSVASSSEGMDLIGSLLGAAVTGNWASALTDTLPMLKRTEDAGYLCSAYNPFSAAPDTRGTDCFGGSGLGAVKDANPWGGFYEFNGLPSCVGPYLYYAALTWAVKFLPYSGYCVSCITPPFTAKSTVTSAFALWQYVMHLKNCLTLEECKSIRLYLLAGCPEEKRSTQWEHPGNWKSRWKRKWGTQEQSKQVLAFDYVVMGRYARPEPSFLETFHPLRSRGEDLAKASRRGDLFGWHGFSLSQARVYNGTAADLFTQDWRTSLVPVDVEQVDSVTASVFLSRLGEIGSESRGSDVQEEPSVLGTLLGVALQQLLQQEGVHH